jgi:hypothetical protein
LEISFKEKQRKKFYFYTNKKSQPLLLLLLLLSLFFVGSQRNVIFVGQTISFFFASTTISTISFLVLCCPSLLLSLGLLHPLRVLLVLAHAALCSRNGTLLLCSRCCGRCSSWRCIIARFVIVIASVVVVADLGAVLVLIFFLIILIVVVIGGLGSGVGIGASSFVDDFGAALANDAEIEHLDARLALGFGGEELLDGAKATRIDETGELVVATPLLGLDLSKEQLELVLELGGEFSRAARRGDACERARSECAA